MSFRYVILGAGRQGVALAYDLAKNGDADEIVLADVALDVAQAACARLKTLLPDAAVRYTAQACDVAQPEKIGTLLAGANVIVSAVPYRFNVALTQAAIAAGASFCDLGGNTDVVRQQLALAEAARSAGVSVVPDCGLAPGLGNALAAHGVASLDTPEEVHVRCGGLPQERVGPLQYKLVFNFDGLINEYSGVGEFLRDGQRVDVPALTELETIQFPPPLGTCEAAVTSGGTSTCPETYLGRLRAYDYKTVRYPGHFAIVRALFDLGCFERRIELPEGHIEPRPLMRRLFEERLAFPQIRDLVVLRVTVSGTHDRRRCRRQYDLLDYHDKRTGFTAMERTTAFPAALVAFMQARRLVPPGAHPLETALPIQQYVEELAQHDVMIQVTAG